MSATVEVPRAILERARAHVTRTGHPLLFRDLRRRRDWELLAVPVTQGYVLAIGPGTPVAQFYVAMSHRYPERNLALDLCRVTAAGLEGFPRRFMCEGITVGVWDVSEDGVCVRGPVALSCMSWALRDRRVGFYVTLSEVQTE